MWFALTIRFWAKSMIKYLSKRTNSVKKHCKRWGFPSRKQLN